MDEIGKVTVVGFDVGLAGTHALALEPERAHVERDLTFLAHLVGRALIFRQEDTDYADTAGGAHRLHQIVHRHVRLFVALRVVRLITHALAAPMAWAPIGAASAWVIR